MKAIKKYRNLVKELIDLTNIWYDDEKYFKANNIPSSEHHAYYRKHACYLLLEQVLYCTLYIADGKVTVLRMMFHFDASRINKDLEELSNRLNQYPDNAKQVIRPIFERYLEPLQKLKSF